MTTNASNPLVDGFMHKAETWREEFAQLRRIMMEFPLTEELKWGVPCYALDKKNIVLIHGFKEYCAMLFFKGALMEDPQGILVQQTENVQAGRQIRFTSAPQIAAMEPLIKEYIQRAIEVERAGLEVEFKQSAQLPMPQELVSEFARMPGLQAAFEALTPGRQRAYLLYFAQPKQAKTRQARIAKSAQQILAGKGLHD